MSDLSKEQLDYINSSWDHKFKGVLQAQDQVLNWLFAVHGAGIAGTLGYAATKGTSCSLKIGLGGFCVGLLTLMIYGAVMYYLEAGCFKSFQDDVAELSAKAIPWEQFIARENKRPHKYKIGEILAWLSAISGLVGIIGLITTVF